LILMNGFQVASLRFRLTGRLNRGMMEAAGRQKLLVACVAVAGCVLIVGGALDVSMRQEQDQRAKQMNIVPNSQSTKLYDIPNFVYQRTQMHFPQAEEGWLNMAAKGQIGDDVKPEKILNNLNSVISDARSHALQENYEARVKAKVDAMEENYDTYDVQKGKVVNKMYGGKQVGGSMTLKPKSTAPEDLPQLAQPQVQGGMMMKQKQMVRAAKPQAKPQPMKMAKAAREHTKPFEVTVPAGLAAGQQFIAQIPGHGNMLVQVPAGTQGGQNVQIEVPVAAKRPVKHFIRRQPMIRRARRAAPGVVPNAGGFTTHPVASSMVDASLADHYRSVPHGVFGLEH